MKQVVTLLVMTAACLFSGMTASAASLSDAELKDLVKRSWQYVAMYNVNNKFAMKQGGWPRPPLILALAKGQMSLPDRLFVLSLFDEHARQACIVPLCDAPGTYVHQR